jgi:hypothetical protein
LIYLLILFELPPYSILCHFSHAHWRVGKQLLDL